MKLIAFLITVVFVNLIKAQAPHKFHTRFGGNGYDIGYDIKQTLDKGYIIAGSTSSFGQGNTDMNLVKLDSMGHIKFQTQFGGYNNDIGKSVVQLQDSSYVILGYTNSLGFGGYDIFLVKTDKNGHNLWQKTIGGNDWDFGHSLQITNDGGFIIGGTTYSYGYGSADAYIIKINNNGVTEWTKTYGGSGDDEIKSIIQTSDGGFACVGYTKSYNDTQFGDMWLFKTNANGDSLWSRFYGGNKEDFARDIVQNAAGDFFIAGATESFGVGLLDAYAIKVNGSNGLILNTFVDGTTGFNEIYNSVTISKSTSNDLVCFAEKELFTGFDLQTKVIEFDFSLNYKNATDYGSVQADELTKIISTEDKGYALIGYTNGYGATLQDVYLLKIDSTLLGGNYSIVSVKESNQISNVKIKLYPNPTTDIIKIETTESKINDTCLKLFDSVGNEIDLNDRKNILENSITLNLKNLSNGIYFINYMNKSYLISIFY